MQFGDFLGKKDEVEIKGDDDYEIVALSPIRRLEKRLETMENTKTTNNLEKFIDKMMDMVELNQKIIEDIVRSNQATREDIGILVGKLDSLQAKISSFVEMVQSAAESDVAQTAAESTTETIKPLIDRLETMSDQTKETNAQLVESLGNIEKLLRKQPQSTLPTSPSSQTARDILARRGIRPQE
ncbi:MAG: hypothetical protein ABIF85_00875 [Nanoarchaeota archaeon]|nr:hypothetical protein [Nanoarchaeota archaeon]MBU4451960.1 hypothetical protein [Nanoarchaeota archaeon]MCG2724119.1 hypothetical protein [archaeon]